MSKKRKIIRFEERRVDWGALVCGVIALTLLTLPGLGVFASLQKIPLEERTSPEVFAACFGGIILCAFPLLLMFSSLEGGDFHTTEVKEAEIVLVEKEEADKP